MPAIPPADPLSRTGTSTSSQGPALQERQNRHMTEQNENTTEKKIWFITGAGRGMGTDIAKAALAAGHAVVATGRNPDKVTRAVGRNENLLAIKLDVTNPADATAAIAAAVDRFGRIDVLVNNAG